MVCIKIAAIWMLLSVSYNVFYCNCQHFELNSNNSPTLEVKPQPNAESFILNKSVSENELPPERNVLVDNQPEEVSINSANSQKMKVTFENEPVQVNDVQINHDPDETNEGNIRKEPKLPQQAKAVVGWITKPYTASSNSVTISKEEMVNIKESSTNQGNVYEKVNNKSDQVPAVSLNLSTNAVHILNKPEITNVKAIHSSVPVDIPRYSRILDGQRYNKVNPKYFKSAKEIDLNKNKIEAEQESEKIDATKKDPTNNSKLRRRKRDGSKERNTDTRAVRVYHATEDCPENCNGSRRISDDAKEEDHNRNTRNKRHTNREKKIKLMSGNNSRRKDERGTRHRPRDRTNPDKDTRNKGRGGKRRDKGNPLMSDSTSDSVDGQDSWNADQRDESRGDFENSDCEDYDDSRDRHRHRQRSKGHSEEYYSTYEQYETIETDQRPSPIIIVTEKPTTTPAPTTTTTPAPTTPAPPPSPQVEPYYDCARIKRDKPESKSGVYTLRRRNNKTFEAYCDMNRGGGGWTVFQKRGDYHEKEDFFRGWNDYRKGFGANKKEEYWLGFNIIHEMTQHDAQSLRIDLADFDGTWKHALYETFAIGSDAERYKLAVGFFSGDAGDSLTGHNNRPFSTRDAGDTYCPKLYKGAWWYLWCHHSNLNGQNLRGQHASYADGINWLGFRGYYYSLKVSQMKMRPRWFSGVE